MSQILEGRVLDKNLKMTWQFNVHGPVSPHQLKRVPALNALRPVIGENLDSRGAQTGFNGRGATLKYGFEGSLADTRFSNPRIWPIV